MIWIAHPVESVCSYVNCSIMPKIPHHPSAFLSSEKFINYATRSVRKRCKFVFYFFLRECESSSGLIHLHPFKHLHPPARTHIPTPSEDVNKPRGQRGDGDSRKQRRDALSQSSRSLRVMLLLRTWWGHLTAWCLRQRYREHHFLQIWSSLIMDPPPRSPANLHPVTCEGKGQPR